MLQALVVAVEYDGADLSPRRPSTRAVLLEHAYDLHSASLPAHIDRAPRIAFPPRSRGWTALPLAPRCPACTATVNRIVLAIITNRLARHRPPPDSGQIVAQ